MQTRNGQVDQYDVRAYPPIKSKSELAELIRAVAQPGFSFDLLRRLDFSNPNTWTDADARPSEARR